jgi:hypothetical protein
MRSTLNTCVVYGANVSSRGRPAASQRAKTSCADWSGTPRMSRAWASVSLFCGGAEGVDRQLQRRQIGNSFASRKDVPKDADRPIAVVIHELGPPALRDRVLNLEELVVLPPVEGDGLVELVDVNPDLPLGAAHHIPIRDRHPSIHRHVPPRQFGQDERAVMRVRGSVWRRLCRQHADKILWGLPFSYLFLEVSECLDVEERDDVDEEEGVQPDRLVHAQRLQRRLVEDRDRTHTHRRIVSAAGYGYNCRSCPALSVGEEPVHGAARKAWTNPGNFKGAEPAAFANEDRSATPAP